MQGAHMVSDMCGTLPKIWLHKAEDWARPFSWVPHIFLGIFLFLLVNHQDFRDLADLAYLIRPSTYRISNWLHPILENHRHSWSLLPDFVALFLGPWNGEENIKHDRYSPHSVHQCRLGCPAPTCQGMWLTWCAPRPGKALLAAPNSPARRPWTPVSWSECPWTS